MLSSTERPICGVTKPCIPGPGTTVLDIRAVTVCTARGSAAAGSHASVRTQLAWHHKPGWCVFRPACFRVRSFSVQPSEARHKVDGLRMGNCMLGDARHAASQLPWPIASCTRTEVCLKTPVSLLAQFASTESYKPCLCQQTAPYHLLECCVRTPSMLGSLFSPLPCKLCLLTHAVGGEATRVTNG